MNLQDSNYIENDCLTDSIKLKELAVDLDLLEFDSTFKTTFFRLYNRSFSFYLYALLQNLFFDRELEIQPYQTNEQNFKQRTLKETGLFSQTKLTLSVDIDVNLNEVWEKAWTLFDKRTSHLFLYNLVDKLYELKRTNKYFIPLLKTKEYKDSAQITHDLALLNTTYNITLLFLLKTLCARQTLLEIHNKSNDFSFFQNEIFRNMLRLDQTHLQVVKELIHFRTQYSLLYQQLQNE